MGVIFVLFLNLENQIFFLIAFSFSFLIFAGSMAIKMQPLKMRVFELAFVIPLFLAVTAFLTATYNISGATSLLILSHILLIVDCSFVLLIPPGADALKLFGLVPFVFVGLGFYLSTPKVYSFLFAVMCFTVFVLLVINLVLLINNMFHNEKTHMAGFAGIFILSSSTGLWLIQGVISCEVLILLALGYLCCTYYVYKNTLAEFFRDYQSSRESLKRMNSSIHAEVIRRVEAIERSNRKLLEKSRTDSMTGLLIKSAILEKLENLLERAPRMNLSILMIDIDNFKHINDTMGHQHGDLCIKALTNIARTSFRQDDIIGRYGGDEFIVVLPDTPSVKAYIIADRFRELIQSRSNPSITISVGISSYPDDAKTPAALIEAADKALYTSKQKGRNTVSLYSAS
jgi:diguanylate cyclase (GGDEF)-like protein